MIQGLRCCLVTSWLVPVPCVGDEVREESIERQQLLPLELVSIEPGIFAIDTSGSRAQLLREREMWDELSRAEQLVGDVAIERGFYLGQYEVTQAQWIGVMGTWPWVANEHVEIGGANPWFACRDVMHRI